MFKVGELVLLNPSYKKDFAKVEPYIVYTVAKINSSFGSFELEEVPDQPYKPLHFNRLFDECLKSVR